MRMSWRSTFLGLTFVCLIVPIQAEAASIRSGLSVENGGSRDRGAESENRSPDNDDENGSAQSNDQGSARTDLPKEKPSTGFDGTSDEDGSNSTLVSVIESLGSDVVAFLEKWQHGPDRLVPQFMANDDEINTALTKILNRPHEPTKK